MATKDFLSAGLNCVEYSNGARHTLVDYADMAIRTACKRAYLQGEGAKRQEWGIHTVIVNKRGNPCPKCLPFCGKVLIDDVWSGGSRKDGSYPLMSTAVAHGLYHPRCKDSHTTYFPGISIADDTWTKEELEAIGQNAKEEARQQYAERQEKRFGKDSHTTYFPGISIADDTWTKEELEAIGQNAKEEARQQYAERQEKRFERLARYSLDPENQKRYIQKERIWKHARFRTGDADSKEYVEYKRPLANFRAIPQSQVVNRLRKEYSTWKQSLNDFELKAVKKYTYNSNESGRDKFYMRLNAMLRGDRPGDERVLRYANGISGAIKKGAIPCDVICYRNMDTNPYSNLDVGDIFVEEQFVSTSVVKNRALQKKFKLIIYVPKGSKAAYIESVSKFPTQREVLIDKGSIYRVISKKEDVIELEVIP